MESAKGRIIKGVGGRFEVMTDKEVILSYAKGSFRHDSEVPTVGDVVTLEYDEKGALIKEICERKNLFIRPPLSNLDYLFCVLPSKDPSPDIFTLDKLISIAEFSKVEPVIVITKKDLDEDFSVSVEKKYENAGFTVFRVSSFEKESIEKLSDFIKTKARDSVSAFAGASGAGKSTLMNSLFKDLKLVTGSLSQKIMRGKNTTRSVELYPLSKLINEDCSGFFADTPGFTMLDFAHFDFFGLEDLPYTFREFDQYIGKCRYTKCTHLCEEGCSIIDAVNEGKIAKSRHESYVSLYSVLKSKPRYKKKQ